jgi:hypothetical protein
VLKETLGLFWMEVTFVLEEIEECVGGKSRSVLEEIQEYDEGKFRIFLEGSYVCAGGNLGVCWRKV